MLRKRGSFRIPSADRVQHRPPGSVADPACGGSAAKIPVWLQVRSHAAAAYRTTER